MRRYLRSVRKLQIAKSRVLSVRLSFFFMFLFLLSALKLRRATYVKQTRYQTAVCTCARKRSRARHFDYILVNYRWPWKKANLSSPCNFQIGSRLKDRSCVHPFLVFIYLFVYFPSNWFLWRVSTWIFFFFFHGACDRKRYSKVKWVREQTTQACARERNRVDLWIRRRLCAGKLVKKPKLRVFM